jgi:hypothetical protein
LDLVGNRQSQQKVCSARADVFGDGENGPEVVRRVAQPAGSQVGVEQIGVAHQHRVEECRLID